MTAQQKRSAKSQKELSLSREALKAFRHFQHQIGLADDSQAVLALIERAEPENLFDATTPQDFFRGSEQPGITGPLTERDLVGRAAQLLGVPLPQLISSGAILLAKREILTRTKNQAPGSGVTGSADQRMQEAFDTLRAAGKPLSPARLAKLSRTNFFSAQRWLGLNHPQLLLHPQQPDSDNSSPLPQGSAKTLPTGAKSSQQEPAKSSPAGSQAPKTKKRAKRVRNLENEPF
jgi:hypothetical protein